MAPSLFKWLGFRIIRPIEYADGKKSWSIQPIPLQAKKTLAPTKKNKNGKEYVLNNWVSFFEVNKSGEINGKAHWFF